jgi:isoleucyl-tRNA synthetase
MGSFYLDVLKDRLYTAPAASRARRSAQTAMHHILEALVRWLAPVISFTADEIWQHMPGERAATVFEAEWHDGLFALDAGAALSRADWDTLVEVRAAVARRLEALRNAGAIGSALDATVTLYCDEPLHGPLARLGTELRFVLLTSEAIVAPAAQRPADAAPEHAAGHTLTVAVEASEQAKCARCWHRRGDVGDCADYPDLCGRCVTNIAGPGEQREHA